MEVHDIVQEAMIKTSPKKKKCKKAKWLSDLKGPGAGGESRKQRAEGGLEEEDPGVLKNARA